MNQIRQGLAIYRWTEWQLNITFANGPLVGSLWHFKDNEDVITKFE